MGDDLRRLIRERGAQRPVGTVVLSLRLVLAAVEVMLRRRPVVGWLFVTGALCLLSMAALDRLVMAWVSTLSRADRHDAQWVTETSNWVLHWLPPLGLLAVGFIAHAVGRWPRWVVWGTRLTAQLWVAGMVAGLTTNLIKVVVGRSRPNVWLHESLYLFDPPGWSYAYQSFPSGHTTVVAGACMMVALRLPRWAWVGALVALGLGMTRVLVQAHWPSDVLAGLYVGSIVAWGLYARWPGFEGWVLARLARLAAWERRERVLRRIRLGAWRMVRRFASVFRRPARQRSP